MGSKNPWADWAQIFLVVGVHDVITPLKFGDDRFRAFWLAEGQSLHFPIYFEGRPYNTHTIVRGVMLKNVLMKKRWESKNTLKIIRKLFVLHLWVI